MKATNGSSVVACCLSMKRIDVEEEEEVDVTRSNQFTRATRTA